MTLDTDIADDFADIIDTPEAVNVTIKRSGETIRIPVAHANRNAMSRRLTAYGGVQLQGDELNWVIPANELGGDGFFSGAPLYEMQQGDKITDANGNSFNVVSARLLTLGTRWACVCRPLAK